MSDKDELNKYAPGITASMKKLLAANTQILEPRNSQPNSLKTKFLQRQLILMLHAYQCQAQEKSNKGNKVVCQLRYCSTMKTILAHVASCKLGKNCPRLNCISAKHIIFHWKNCACSNCCLICGPLKEGTRIEEDYTKDFQRSWAEIINLQPNKPFERNKKEKRSTTYYVPEWVAALPADKKHRLCNIAVNTRSQPAAKNIIFWPQKFNVRPAVESNELYVKNTDQKQNNTFAFRENAIGCRYWNVDENKNVMIYVANIKNSGSARYYEAVHVYLRQGRKIKFLKQITGLTFVLEGSNFNDDQDHK